MGVIMGPRSFLSRLAELCVAAAFMTVVAACGGGGGAGAPELTSITILGIPSAALMPGNSVQMSARANYSDQSTKDVTTTVSWSTTDASVLTVSPAGLLTVQAPGQAEVVATLSGVGGRASVQAVPLQISAYELRLTGDPEVMIADGQFGLHCIPDAHITFRRTPSGIDLWFAASDAFTQFGGGTVRLQGTFFETLAPNPSSDGKAVPVFLPSGSGFDKDYAGATSVLTAANGTDLLMIYHAEAHNCGGLDTPSTFGIGLARSSDGGLTWTRQGQIISSSVPQAPCDSIDFYFNGAANPVVVTTRDRDYYYLYFVDYIPGESMRNAVSVARSPVSADAAPGSWTKYYRGRFSEPGLGGSSDLVIRPANAGEVPGSAEMPSVSYNLILQRYLAVVTTDASFNYTASEDGIHWEPARSLGFGEGCYPFCYPSLLSLDQPSDGTTTDRGYLYYAHRGVQGTLCHFMERRAFQIFH